MHTPGQRDPFPIIRFDGSEGVFLKPEFSSKGELLNRSELDGVLSAERTKVSSVIRDRFPDEISPIIIRFIEVYQQIFRSALSEDYVSAQNERLNRISAFLSQISSYMETEDGLEFLPFFLALNFSAVENGNYLERISLSTEAEERSLQIFFIPISSNIKTCFSDFRNHLQLYHDWKALMNIPEHLRLHVSSWYSRLILLGDDNAFSLHECEECHCVPDDCVRLPYDLLTPFMEVVDEYGEEEALQIFELLSKHCPNVKFFRSILENYDGIHDCFPGGVLQYLTDKVYENELIPSTFYEHFAIAQLSSDEILLVSRWQILLFEYVKSKCSPMNVYSSEYKGSKSTDTSIPLHHFQNELHDLVFFRSMVSQLCSEILLTGPNSENLIAVLRYYPELFTDRLTHILEDFSQEPTRLRSLLSLYFSTCRWESQHETKELVELCDALLVGLDSNLLKEFLDIIITPLKRNYQFADPNEYLLLRFGEFILKMSTDEQIKHIKWFDRLEAAEGTFSSVFHTDLHYFIVLVGDVLSIIRCTNLFEFEENETKRIEFENVRNKKKIHYEESKELYLKSAFYPDFVSKMVKALDQKVMDLDGEWDMFVRCHRERGRILDVLRKDASARQINLHDSVVMLANENFDTESLINQDDSRKDDSLLTILPDEMKGFLPSAIFRDAFSGKLDKYMNVERERCLGLMPIGGKVHLTRAISDSMLEAFSSALGVDSTPFRLIHSGQSLVLPPVSTSLEMKLMILVLQRVGIIDNKFPELQFAMAGRWPNDVAGIVGASVLLGTDVGVRYLPGAFRTTLDHLTGARIMAYDGGVKESGLSNDLPNAVGRTDMLGRRSVNDADLYQFLGTLASHTVYGGMFSGLFFEYRRTLENLLDQSGLLGAVSTANWIADPHTQTYDWAAERHYNKISELTQAWMESKDDPEGIHAQVRDLIFDFMDYFESIRCRIMEENKSIDIDKNE